MKCKAYYYAAVAVALGFIDMVSSFPQPGDTKMSEVPRVTAAWEEPLAYLDESTELFGQRLKAHGVENLPVPNKNFTVNDTRYNIRLEGNVQYTNGFVLDILNISRYYRQYVWYFEDGSAFIKYKILMGGVSILYDLHGDLEVDHNLVGTAELTFPENLIEVLISCNTTTKAVTVESMVTNAVNGPKTNYAPDSSVMKAVAYNARLTMAKSLFSDLTLWIENSLKQLLETVVQDVPFPLTYTKNDKRKKPYTISTTFNRRRWRV